MQTNTHTNTFETKRPDQRFEFILFINNTKFIVQRFFDIRDFNEDSIKSLELKELMDNIAGMNIDSFGTMGLIPKFLKQKSVEYLWANYNPYHIQQDEGVKSIYDKVDNFQFEIRIDKRTVAKSEFSGNVFPPKVRYDVNIKEIIPAIIAEIRHFLSQKNYTIIEVSPTAYDIYYNEEF